MPSSDPWCPLIRYITFIAPTSKDLLSSSACPLGRKRHLPHMGPNWTFWLGMHAQSHNGNEPICYLLKHRRLPPTKNLAIAIYNFTFIRLLTPILYMFIFFVVVKWNSLAWLALFFCLHTVLHKRTMYTYFHSFLSLILWNKTTNLISWFKTFTQYYQSLLAACEMCFRARFVHILYISYRLSPPVPVRH